MYSEKGKHLNDTDSLTFCKNYCERCYIRCLEQMLTQNDGLSSGENITSGSDHYFKLY